MLVSIVITLNVLCHYNIVCIMVRSRIKDLLTIHMIMHICIYICLIVAEVHRNWTLVVVREVIPVPR